MKLFNRTARSVTGHAAEQPSDGQWLHPRLDSGDIAFVAVVVAAYASILVAGAAYTVTTLAILVGLGLLYTLIGTYGFLVVQRRDVDWIYALYFVVQLLISGLIVYLSQAVGLVAFALLPLVGHATVALSWRWLIVFCLLLMLMFSYNIALLAGWQTAVRSAVTFPAGIVFVLLFTRLTLRAEQARDEASRLAVELSTANRKLGEYAAQAEELATTRERNRFAREIHDGLGHYLTVINIQLEAARAVLDIDRSRALDAINKAQMLTKDGLAEIRRSVAALRLSPTDRRSLPEAIAVLVDEGRASGLVAELDVRGTPRQLAPAAELTLYRAAQEALTNIRKHAQANRADLTLDYTDSAHVHLTVQDDGIGTAAATGGFGLLGVRERVQLLGGDVVVQTAPGQGFGLRVEVPG